MGLLDTSIRAGQAATDTADAAASAQARNYLTNEAIRYGLQEGVGQLAGFGLGYLAHKKTLAALQKQQQPTQQPTQGHSQIAGTAALHAMNEWHPVYDFTAASVATPESLGAPGGGYDLSGDSNG